VEDATQSNDQLEPAGEGAADPNRPRASGLGPVYALLRAVLGDRIPTGPLGPDTVPAKVLELPIRLATEALVNHFKRCRDPRCAYVPARLARYRSMRPDAIRKDPDVVSKVLWLDAGHELVTYVRKQILEGNGDLADEISAGKLLEGDRLGEILAKVGPGARLLAAVLWASKFNGPHAEALFRSLVPIAEDRPSRDTRKVVSIEDPDSASLKAERRQLVRALNEAKRNAEQGAHDLQVKERMLQRSRHELEEAQRKYRDTAEKLEHLQERLHDTEAARQTIERDAEKATRVNADLRRELRTERVAQRELGLERSDLARQLASERRELEHLKLRLDSLPNGADAVWEFLQAEEERIRTNQAILAGGAKARADEEWAAHRKLEKTFLDAYPKYREPPPVKIRPKTSLRLVALGGSAEVGRSCYLLELGEHRILVDCGIKPSGSEDLSPEIHHLERIDAVILTHAHTDHIGWVPALVRRFPDVAIYCSEGTAALLPVMLEDCRQHYIRKLAIMRGRAKYSRNAAIVAEEYDEEDMHAVSNLAITCNFGEEEILLGDVSVRFYRAGHILGAASVLIEDQSGRRVFFSGDFSSFPQLTVQGASWPEDIGKVDLLVLESTYGKREHHKPLADSRNDLVSFIRETIDTREGSVVLASFALGRAQELLKTIAIARQAGELPASVPVHVDGMIRRINPIYRKLADFDVALEEFNEVSGETERNEIALAAQVQPSIIVTTSGMLTGGPVVEYARRLLPDARHRIVLTGYQDEGAPSSALRELAHPGGGPRIVEIADQNGELVHFEAARPAKEIGLSAHADRAGLIEYAGRLRPAVIALVHGEPAAQEELRFRLSQIHARAEIACGPTELAVP
jgi:Cft2 family RNA processing exonuclease